MAESVAKRPITDLTREATSKLGRAITTPLTDLPSRVAKRVSTKISPPNEVGSPLRGFMSGAVEGLGNQLTDMTSPLSLGMGALSGGAGALLSRGARSAARVAKPLMAPPPTFAAGRLPAEMVAVGDEAIHNAPRMLRMADEAANVRQISQANPQPMGSISNYGNQAPSRASDLGEKMTNLRKVREEAAIREGRKELGRK